MLLRLSSLPGLEISENVPLSQCTRFGVGGPARWVVNATSEAALTAALAALREDGIPHTVMGGGTNLIASDDGFPGAIVRYTNTTIEIAKETVHVASGVVLQDLVDQTIAQRLAGLQTLTGIPGWVGGAVYGNAGAYGHSIHERTTSVTFLDGAQVHTIDNPACEFRYRESIFKRNKNWIILSAELQLERAAAAGLIKTAADLLETAAGIRKIRDEKYPPTMRCAGSIFKNLIFAELPSAARAQVPEKVIREGKIPSAYFLEQAEAKGMVLGGMKVADYHANLIYNQGGGTAAELRELIAELKRRVFGRFGIELEEEVQYI